MATDDKFEPFIEKPDIIEKEHGTGLYCFFDAARPCTSECMAYLVAQPEGRDYEQQQWSRCSVLVNLHKIGKHAVALAGQGEALLKHLRVKRADDARNNQPLPPKVL